MSFTRQVYLEVDGEKDLTLLMAYHNGESEPDWFEIEVFKGKDAVGKARWEVDAAHFAFIFDPSSVIANQSSACITQCLGISVSKGLIECLWTSQGDIQKIRKCIKDKAIGVLLDGAGCVAACL
jgi:hypothetical protein